MLYNKSAITPTKDVNINLNATNNENNTEDLPVYIEVKNQKTDQRLQELRDELNRELSGPNFFKDNKHNTHDQQYYYNY